MMRDSTVRTHGGLVVRHHLEEGSVVMAISAGENILGLPQCVAVVAVTDGFVLGLTCSGHVSLQGRIMIRFIN